MPLDEDLRYAALLLGIQSPSLRLLRSYHKVDVSVLPTTSFVAKTRKLATNRYEVTLSVGVWMALNFLLRQGATNYEADPHDAFEVAIDRVALLTGDGRMRVVRFAELEERKDWNWYEMPSIPVDGELEVFLSGYLAPAINGGAYDLRVELAVAFLALHEMNHVMQGHFESRDTLSIVHRKQIEILSDIRAVCGFPGLMDHCAVMFSVDGRKRCNILVASGLSIGCAVFCLQMLNRSTVNYPSPTVRMMALVTLMATGFLPREIAKSDREYLIVGLSTLLKSFGHANDDSTIPEFEVLLRGAVELDKRFGAHPSQYALAFAKLRTAQGVEIEPRSDATAAMGEKIPEGEPVSDVELRIGILIRNAWDWLCRTITAFSSASR